MHATRRHNRIFTGFLSFSLIFNSDGVDCVEIEGLVVGRECCDVKRTSSCVRRTRCASPVTGSTPRFTRLKMDTGDRAAHNAVLANLEHLTSHFNLPSCLRLIRPTRHLGYEQEQMMECLTQLWLQETWPESWEAPRTETSRRSRRSWRCRRCECFRCVCVCCGPVVWCGWWIWTLG